MRHGSVGIPATIISVLLLLTGCGRKSTGEAENDVPSPKALTNQSSDKVEQQSSSWQVEPTASLPRIANKPRTPSEIGDESELARMGFATSRSGLDVPQLEAAFVDASCTEDGAGNIDAFLRAGYSPDAENARGVRPLHCAAARGDAALVRRLLDAGADPDAATASYWLRPIHYAATGPHLDIVRMLVEAEADLDAESDQGTALLIATRNAPKADFSNNYEVAVPEAYTVLRELGAGVAGIDEDGNSLLHNAWTRGNDAWIRALLDARADVNARNKAGETVLAVAVRHLRFDTSRKPVAVANRELIQRLIKLGADVDARDKAGLPIVMRIAQVPDLYQDFAAANADFDALGKHCESFWRALLSYQWGYMPDEQYALVFAVADAVGEIDEEPTVDGNHCSNPLVIAAGIGDPRLVHYFLERGINPNIVGEFGRNALQSFLAATPKGNNTDPESQLRVLQELINADADVNARDGDGKSPLQLAAQRPPEFAALLREHGAK